MVARILCPTLETMLKKTLLAICEVNIKYSNKLEIGGSIHIRSDGDKVLTFLLDEELPSSGSVVNGQENLVTSAVDLVQRITRGSIHEESLVPNGDNVSDTADQEEHRLHNGDQQVHSSPEASHSSHTSSSNRRKKSHPVKVEPMQDYMDDSALDNDLDSSDLDHYADPDAHATPDLISMEDMEVISTPSSVSPTQPSSTDESQPTDLSLQSSSDPRPPVHGMVSVASSLKTCIVRPVDVHPLKSGGLNSPQNLIPAQEAISGTQPSPHLAAQVLTSMLPQTLPVMSPMSQSQSMAQQRDEMMLMQQSMMGMMALQAHTAPGLPLSMGMQPMFAGMPLKMEQMSPPIAASNTMPINITPAVPNNSTPDGQPTRGRKAQAFSNINNFSQAITDEKGNKKWQCVLCGIMLSSKFYLNSHINAVHTRTRIYPCEICGKLYYSHGAMRIHKLRQHWVDKRHKCPHCNQKFVLPFELRAHIARKHKQSVKSE